MEKYIKRKLLTPEQYKMANGTMAIILAVCHLLYCGVEFINSGSAEGGNTYALERGGIYILLAVLNVIAVKRKGEQKICMFIIPLWRILDGE